MKNPFQKIIPIFAIAFSLPAEAKNYAWSAEKHEGDEVQYKDGNPVICRDKQSYYICVKTNSSDFYGRPVFSVVIGNRTLEPFNFGTENITISFDGQTEETKVLNRQDLISVVNNKAGWAAFATGMLGGSTTSRTTTTTPFGTYSSRTTNPSNDYSRINGAASSVVDWVNTNVYATSTIPTGKQYPGVVVSTKPDVRKTPSIAHITIRMSEYTESFDVTMIQKK